MNVSPAPIKVAFETVLYGRRFGDIERALDEIASAGFQGVEFAQSPAMLRRDGVKSIQTLRTLLQDRNLELVALAGGTLKERMDFCGDSRLVSYLYVEDVEPAFAEALEKNYRLALHPHLFMPVHRMNEAREVLNKAENKKLWFLPDTAHLALSGDDVAQAIKEFAPRLAGLHLKDWSRQFGRYSHRYARGFVELGQGIVGWPKVLDQIDEVARHRFPGDPLWITVELDSTRTTTWNSLRECARWLHEKRPAWIGAPKDEVARRASSPVLGTAVKRPQSLVPADKELAFRRRLTVASTRSSATFYQEAADAYQEIIPCLLVQVWIFTPSDERLDLMGRSGECMASGLAHMNCKKNHSDRPLCAQVIDEMEARAFDLVRQERSFLDKGLLDHLLDPAQHVPGQPVPMLSIPISNTWNSHHIRFVVNLFPKGEMPDGRPLEAAWFSPKGEVIPGSPLDLLLEDLSEVSLALSPEADSMLDERALAATGRIQSYRPDKGFSAGRDEFTRFFAEAVRQSLDAEAVAVFLEDPVHDRLECRASVPGMEWADNLAPGERFYFPGEDRNTARAWTSGEIRFMATAERALIPWKSRETVSHPQSQDSIFAPIVSSRRNEAMGVVRCTNKSSGPAPDCGDGESRSRMFTDDDAAVLDVILQVASPIFSQLEVQDEQIAILGKIVHEFHLPLVAIQGAVDLIRAACQRKQVDPLKFFGNDYLGDIVQWTELVGRLVNGADVFRRGYQGALELRLQECQFMSDIVVPSVRHIDRLLLERGFSPQAIVIGSFEAIPRLMKLDRNQMQQVIFNLLSNAVKYAEGRSTFGVTITTHRLKSEYIVRFEDKGPGVAENLKEEIFRSGFRGPDAHLKYVAGQGLGLFVVRAIMDAHGGSVSVVKGKPFIIDLKLPADLAVV